MIKRVLIVGVLALLALPLEAQTGFTIYSGGRVLVRRTIPATVPQGPSSHALALGAMEPGSLFALDPDVTLTGTAYDAAVDEPSTMRRAVGRKLVFDTGVRTNNLVETIEAEVLAVDPERFRLPGGEIVFQRPGRPRYPADLVYLAPTTTVAVQSGARKDALNLGWFTGGAGWMAQYQLVLGKGTARATGQAVILNSGLSADNAELQVLAGDVGRGGAMPKTMPMMAAREMTMDVAGAPAAEEAIGEAHLYTIPGRYTLRPGVTTTAALFQPATASWERIYTVPGTMPWMGPLQQYGDEMKQPVEVHYLVKRPRPGEFGDRPLPGGNWRIFEADAGGRLQMIGEAGSRHQPAGVDLRLAAGSAFDLTATRVQTEYATTREARRTIATAAYTVTLTNAKDSVVTIDVLEERQGEWQILASSVPGEKLSSTQTRFRMRVPAKGEAVLTYRVRVVW
ncbi:MAG TPA: hypothetical protein VF862_00620 [Gemmatimonadales bacterium]